MTRDLEEKVAHLKLVQSRSERELWFVIDKIANYCQNHELVLTQLRRRQWAVLAMTATSVGLGILNLLGK
jgi:hypothetical protein